MPEPDRYEPLPGFAELPGWIWRKLGRTARIAIGVALFAGVALAVALAPQISESKRERAEAERRERAAARAERVRQLEVEQRPRFRRSDAPGANAADRAALLDDVSSTILADARRRVRLGDLRGPIDRVECRPFPSTAEPAHEDPSRRRGRYACVAVTATGSGQVIGHPYRIRVDFESGRYAYCKISGAPGPTRDPLVTIPRACGGGS